MKLIPVDQPATTCIRRAIEQLRVSDEDTTGRRYDKTFTFRRRKNARCTKRSIGVVVYSRTNENAANSLWGSYPITDAIDLSISALRKDCRFSPFSTRPVADSVRRMRARVFDFVGLARRPPPGPSGPPTP